VQNLFQIGVFLSQFEENHHNRQISLSVGVNEMGFKGVMFTENHARKPPIHDGGMNGVRQGLKYTP